MPAQITRPAPQRRLPAKQRRLNLLLGCTALALLPASLSAQDAATPYRLSPIIVDGVAMIDSDATSFVAQELWVGGKVATSILDTPASVSVVTSAEIARRDAETLEEVLNYTPGIHTDFYGSDDRNDYVLVRGFQATSYRDGMTLGSMRGVREDPYAYERVEAIRGANSTLFGVSDPGGSINFVSKQPRFERFGEVFVTGGTNDRRELGVDFGDVLNEEGTLAYRLTGKVQDSALDYDTSRDDSSLLMGSVTWQPTDATALTFVVDRLEQDGTPNSGGYPLDGDYDRDLFFGEPDTNDHVVERNTASAFLRHEFLNGLNLRANLRYSELTDDFGYVYLAQGATDTGTVLGRDYFGSDSSAEELIGNAMLQYDAQFAAFDSSTLLGVEYRDAQSESASFFDSAAPIDVANPVYSGGPANPAQYADDSRDYRTTSLFLQQNLSFDDRFIATLGVRRDWLDLSTRSVIAGTDESDTFAETSLRGALTYKITPDLSTYVSYVESVAPPAIGVAPERGQQYEAGVKYQPAGTNALISAAVFDLEKNNITVANVQDDGTILRELVGETRVRGFEIEGKAELSDTISVFGGYSYIDTEVVRSAPLRGGADPTGNQFANVPQHTASLWLDYTRPASGAVGEQTFGIGARYVGEYFYALSNDTGQSDATVLVDAAYSYDFNDTASVALNVSNLFDDQHVVGSGTANYYNPARTVALTVKQSW